MKLQFRSKITFTNLRFSMRNIFIIIVLVFSFVGCTSKQGLKEVQRGSSFVKRIFNKADIPESRILNKIPIDTKLENWAVQNGFQFVSGRRSVEILGKDGACLGKMTQVGNQKVITSFALLERKTINPLLEKELFANATYKIESSIFKTDKLGRVTSAEISSISNSVVTRNAIQGTNEQAKAMAKDGIKGLDHGGHLIAHSLGGNSGAINIVAQLGTLNKGAFRSVEVLVSKSKSLVKNYKVNVIYKGESMRPQTFMQAFEYRGNLKELQRMKQRNPNFNYIKKNASGGRSYYECNIFHSNS